VDALRGSRAFLAWDCHVGCRFVSGLFARPMAAGLDGLSTSRGSHLDFALDAHPLAAGGVALAANARSGGLRLRCSIDISSSEKRPDHAGLNPRSSPRAAPDDLIVA
jgi:hypothetical protein